MVDPDLERKAFDQFRFLKAECTNPGLRIDGFGEVELVNIVCHCMMCMRSGCYCKNMESDSWPTCLLTRNRVGHLRGLSIWRGVSESNASSFVDLVTELCAITNQLLFFIGRELRNTIYEFALCHQNSIQVDERPGTSFKATASCLPISRSATKPFLPPLFSTNTFRAKSLHGSSYNQLQSPQTNSARC